MGITRLDRFKKTPEHVGRYRQAMDTLRQIGVDQILLEFSLPLDISVASAGAGTAAIASLYESIGYRRCLEEIFNLDVLQVQSRLPLVVDFGASAKMGLTPEETAEFNRSPQ